MVSHVNSINLYMEQGLVQNKDNYTTRKIFFTASSLTLCAKPFALQTLGIKAKTLKKAKPTII